jgi:hypothetical protein
LARLKIWYIDAVEYKLTPSVWDPKMEFLVNMKAAEHDHGYQVVPSDPTLRVNAIESLLVDMKRFQALSGRLFAAFITLASSLVLPAEPRLKWWPSVPAKLPESASFLSRRGPPNQTICRGQGHNVHVKNAGISGT